MRSVVPIARDRGQTLVETALVLPLFLMVIFGIIVLGIGVFNQQQLTNAAREAARFAAINSATAVCSTVPRLPYNPVSPPLTYRRCDPAELGWPRMTAHGREATFAVERTAVQISACWSSYRDSVTNAYDSAPPGNYDIAGSPVTVASTFVQCHIDGHDPTGELDAIGCRSGLPTTDQGSAMSEAVGRPIANTVTAYACYVWRPPLAGFLLIPETVIQRAAITEAIQRQQ
ncbi:MAG TPA: TadE family protein [Candidatus Limnocylindrales bacterium]|nr:TadE family protein [Candidatus Limnocylindrales bacterium]